MFSGINFDKSSSVLCAEVVSNFSFLKNKIKFLDTVSKMYLSFIKKKFLICFQTVSSERVRYIKEDWGLRLSAVTFYPRSACYFYRINWCETCNLRTICLCLETDMWDAEQLVENSWFTGVYSTKPLNTQKYME